MMDLGTDKKFLVLQGGGALGAYQAGAYEALHEAGVRPEWIAGISIGAINAAIIAGSPDDRRVANLRRFWEMATTGPGTLPVQTGPLIRKWLNEYAAAFNAAAGVNGFYIPRALMPWQYVSEPDAAISFYDTSPLIDTLNELVDFDRINRGKLRLSLGAVDVETGNFAYFDTHPCRQRERPLEITVHHVAASGALPPGFPPVEIDGKFYWDGGLVSNTPFQWIIDERDSRDDICVFQVDLFAARGRMPRDMSDVLAREKEIRYSSRTRLNTNEAARHERYRKALGRLLARLPPEFADDRDVKYLKSQEERGAVTAVHLIYARKPYETHAMDNEFSRLTMEEHWRAGYDDVIKTFASPQWTNRVIPEDGFVSVDYRRDHNRPEGGLHEPAR
ncbi:patatin-like phospholipase family protein [Rhizobium sp.]